MTEVGALLRRHRPFAVVLAVGAVLRIIAMLGYRPAMWFNDSFDYIHDSTVAWPHPIRPSGYGFFLGALEPFHSFALIVGLQHLMGLAIAVMVYALLRARFGLPGWGATLAAAPVLLDAYEIQLEHLILSDVPFTFLMVAAITLLLWRGGANIRAAGATLSWKVGALVGLLVGVSALTRSVGLPVLLAVVTYMIVRRVRWQVIAATVALCVLPITAYSAWFYSWYGKFAMTQSSGVFLYGRTMAFADCNKINPPVDLYGLCTIRPAANRPISQAYIWTKMSTLHRLPADRWTELQDDFAGDFAKRAILAQPGDYLKVVERDFLRVFRWNRTIFPDRKTYAMYEFGTQSKPLPIWKVSSDTTAGGEADAYEAGPAQTKIVEPFAGVIRGYQKIFYLRGSMLGVIILVGLAGMVPLWRRWGGVALLPWITTVGLLLLPAATAEFDYRYVLPTVPLACIAAALTFSAEPRQRLVRLLRRRKDQEHQPVEDTDTPQTDQGRAPQPVS